MFKNIRHIHFVGIGGSGMSGIAEVLLKLGYKVTGSDAARSAVAARLEELGATVYIGHAARHVEGADVVVTSTAIAKSNPEVRQSHSLDIPVIPRIEMLAEIARLKYTIALAGTHGKTTTTSLVGQIFSGCGLDPTVIVGGRLKAVGTGGVLGNGDFLVAEADESDGSFLKLSPAISVITNIDNDHLDYYGSEAALKDAFVRFAGLVPFYGITFLCREDPGVRSVLKKITRRHATYGFHESCDIRATDVVLDERGARFQVVYLGRPMGEATVPLAGRHNVLNALAAIAVALHAGLPFDQIVLALSRFEGVGRRMEHKGEASGVTVVDDYGHHPTEIRATLAAMKGRYPGRRVVVLFQPHRYTRTQLLAREFGAALSSADRLLLMPIYAASEKPIRGVTSQSIARHLRTKNWRPVEAGEAQKVLLEELSAGDVLLTLGAGDVWKIGETFIKQASDIARRVSSAAPTLAPRLKSQEPLSRHCTWAIGGAADVYVELQTIDELRQLQSACRSAEAPLVLLGWGSNVLLPDEGVRGVVVRLRGEFEQIEFDGPRVRVGAGVHLPRLAKLCAQRGLDGAVGLAGVPGTVGGALMTNAGTPRGTIGDVLVSVDVIEDDGSIRRIPRSDIRIEYRHTNLRGRCVVAAELELRPSSVEAVTAATRAELENRERTQPLGTKNVGSTFRNPEGGHAGRLIEEAGLKGFQMGRVRVSPKHANFIENMGGATAAEALALIRHVQAAVLERSGVQLATEVIALDSQGRPA